MDGALHFYQCATAGCNSVVMIAGEKHCLIHGTSPQRSQNGLMQSDSRGSLASSFRPAKVVASQDPYGSSTRNMGSEEQSRLGQSRDGRSTSRESLRAAVQSTGSRPMTWKSNLPPDLLNKHAMTARKSTASVVLSKGRTEMPSSDPTTLSITHEGPLATTKTSSQSRPFPTSKTCTQALKSKDFTQLGKPARNGAHPGARTSINGQNQRKTAQGDLTSEKTIPSPVTSMTQAFRTSQQHMAAKHTISNGVSTGLDPRSQLNAKQIERNAKENVNNVPSSAGSSNLRGFRSFPFVRTRFRPPTSIKSAPPIPRPEPAATSHAKRKRDSSSSVNSNGTSSDEFDDYLEEEDEDEEENAGSQSLSMTAAQAATSVQNASSPVFHEGTTALDNTMQAVATRNGLVHNSFHSNAYGRNGNYLSDLNRPSSGVAHNPVLVSGHERVYQQRVTNGDVRPTIEQNDYQTRQAQRSVSSAQNERMLVETDEQWLTRPPVPKKLTCEQRRLQMCIDFDPVRFDAKLYGQPEASNPPEDVFVPAAPTYEAAVPASDADHKRLYMHIDPRIHWPHNRSEQWYKRKMEEIKARGGRKANFGKAAQRMRQQRLAEERRAAEEAEEAAAAAKQGTRPPGGKPAEPWSHHRPMDFADVPDEELPHFVRNNPAWMHAVAIFRNDRARNLRINEQAVALRNAGQPWEHLFRKVGP